MKNKLYRVNSSESFNMQSMYDHLKAIECQDIEGEIKLTSEEWDDLQKRIVEVEDLLPYCYVGMQVTWDKLKRIREITAERQMIRYANCLAAGMSERDAAGAFAD